jgi:zinc-ribbon domain
MAFCNSCGANLDSGAKFCSKCGGVTPDAPATNAYSQASPVQVPGQSSSALKVILIAVAVVIGLGVLGTVAVTFIGLHLAHNTRIETSDGKVSVKGPFGSVVTTKDPEEAAKDLGVDAYPGAHALQGGAASVNIGGSHTVAANFESDDPPEKVAEFYKSKFPDARVAVSDEKHYSIVSVKNKQIVTINIEPAGDKTMIHIATVNGNGAVDDSKD